MDLFSQELLIFSVLPWTVGLAAENAGTSRLEATHFIPQRWWTERKPRSPDWVNLSKRGGKDGVF